MPTSAVNIKRIAICTGGGDAPGLNAVIRAAVLSAINRDWEIYGIRDGFNGLLMPEQLIAGGGDGSMAIANELSKKGLWVVGVPKTIDNDLDKTVITFGFDTACSFTVECLDRLHTTAASHNRIIVMEVMGRYAGWIALESGLAGSADVVLIPEIPYDLKKVAEKVRDREERGSLFSIVVVAEGAKPKGGTVSGISRETGRAERLGGCGEK